MKHTKAAALAAVATLATLGIHSSAFAFDGTPRTQDQQQRSPRMETAALDTALTNNDYAAFTAALAGKPKPADAKDITPAIFSKMVEAHALRAAGKHTEAAAIMKSIGFERPHMNERGRGNGGMPPMPQTLTDAQKNAWGNAKKLFDAGKRDEAKQVLDAAGIAPHEREPRNEGARRARTQ